MRLYDGDASDWLDLSTGINPVPYPFDPVPSALWERLPRVDDHAALLAASRSAFQVEASAAIIAAPGCSALIRLMPRLTQPARVAISAPTYNEHAAAFRAEGWEVTERPGPGVTAAVIVNPNNPDGRLWSAQELLLLAEALDLLVVDESFVDPTPETSVVGKAGADNLIILRSFGKFYGLAGVRLGFAITGSATAARLAEMLGPWAVSGPALAIGTQALADGIWADRMRDDLSMAADRLIALASAAGWARVGGTALFQTFATPDAAATQHGLAEHRIWSRIFPYSKTWLRLGLPSGEENWSRLERAIQACSQQR